MVALLHLAGLSFELPLLLSEGFVHLLKFEIGGFDNCGLYVGSMAAAADYARSVLAQNVYVHNCYYGFRLVSGGEYAQFLGVKAYACANGIHVNAGNVKVNGGSFEYNWRGAWVDGTSCPNPAHGQFVGCSFNHASGGGVGVYVLNVAYGEMFTACAFWFASVYVSQSTGVVFVGNHFSSSTITFDSGTGANFVTDNWFYGSVTKSQLNSSKVVWRNNLTNGAPDAN